MKQILIGLLLSCIPFLGSCAPEEPAEATVVITAPDGYAATCPTNYTRSVPHFCTLATSLSVATLVNDNTCRSVNFASLYGVSTSARLLRVGVEFDINSQSVVGTRRIDLALYSNSACTTQVYPNLIFEAREEVAIAVTELSHVRFLVVDMIPAANAVLFYKGLLTLCANCSSGITSMGFYD